MTRAFVFLALSCTWAAGALAQGAPVQVVCPIDGSVFQFQPPPPATSRETYLDMRPVETAPDTWPHPKCPGNGFVLYKKKFSEDEIAHLRPFVYSDRYRSMVDVHSTRYLESALRRHMGDSLYAVAWSLVQATWEVSSDPARYKQYAEEALAAYDAIPFEALRDNRHRVLKEMVSGELARRLGRFESARERFLEVRDKPEFGTPFLQRIITLQLGLIRARDTASHRIPY
jgi:hypothetical protein